MIAPLRWNVGAGRIFKISFLSTTPVSSTVGNIKAFNILLLGRKNEQKKRVFLMFWQYFSRKLFGRSFYCCQFYHNIIAFFQAVNLHFSVLVSVYITRGHWVVFFITVIFQSNYGYITLRRLRSFAFNNIDFILFLDCFF